EKDGERVQARWLVLTHDELAMPGARSPVDAAERVARPVFANPEQLTARARPSCGGARLQLAGLAAAGQRREPGQHQRDLRVRTRPAATKEPQGIAGSDGPTAGSHGPSPQHAQDLHPVPASSLDDTGGEPDLRAADLAPDPDRPASASPRAQADLEVDAVLLEERCRTRTGA